MVNIGQEAEPGVTEEGWRREIQRRRLYLQERTLLAEEMDHFNLCSLVGARIKLPTQKVKYLQRQANLTS